MQEIKWRERKQGSREGSSLLFYDNPLSQELTLSLQKALNPFMDGFLNEIITFS
jgi:hypothetical protein